LLRFTCRPVKARLLQLLGASCLLLEIARDVCLLLSLVLQTLLLALSLALLNMTVLCLQLLHLLAWLRYVLPLLHAALQGGLFDWQCQRHLLLSCVILCSGFLLLDCVPQRQVQLIPARYFQPHGISCNIKLHCCCTTDTRQLDAHNQCLHRQQATQST